ncbi:rhodanese-like domain-containing protein [Gilvimarinus xylanilyticus]|uniref:Rhodanese-like domain-containing protein n=1 Tax=Gilvimarinus xylanilyticus TaxID=2944139 RepID=A0A9X2I1D4_9GAMM|nr:rhodanese-like domain-containing protein [Gilvimarinus xylanilyticus]MCP8898550.1 rhodanese-like domain-containing protein [Gilvimarinus xylanilyticus]
MKLIGKILAVVAMLMAVTVSAGQEKVTWIDVRTAEEYAGGHLDGALNIPHEQIGKQIDDLALAKNAPVVLYCRSGRRADIALQVLKARGYSNVYNAESLAGARRYKESLASDKQGGR